MAMLLPDTSTLRDANHTALELDDDELSLALSDNSSIYSSSHPPQLTHRTVVDSSDDESDNESVDKQSEDDDKLPQLLFANCMQVRDRSQSPPAIQVRQQPHRLPTSSRPFWSEAQSFVQAHSSPTDDTSVASFSTHDSNDSDGIPTDLPGLIDPDTSLWLHDGEQFHDADANPTSVDLQPVQYNGEHDEPVATADRRFIIDPDELIENGTPHHDRVMQTHSRQPMIDRGANPHMHSPDISKILPVQFGDRVRLQGFTEAYWAERQALLDHDVIEYYDDIVFHRRDHDQTSEVIVEELEEEEDPDNDEDFH